MKSLSPVYTGGSVQMVTALPVVGLGEKVIEVNREPLASVDTLCVQLLGPW
jgi:hypothetical protein